MCAVFSKCFSKCFSIVQWGGLIIFLCSGSIILIFIYMINKTDLNVCHLKVCVECMLTGAFLRCDSSLQYQCLVAEFNGITL